ncbi:hypothetical protein DFQ26_003045 [Actinomortierella ambigua]|nr:hypothetical protein DFQ26_003045 [Actinomortierella ambigua]
MWIRVGAFMYCVVLFEQYQYQQQQQPNHYYHPTRSRWPHTRAGGTQSLTAGEDELIHGDDNSNNIDDNDHDDGRDHYPDTDGENEAATRRTDSPSIAATNNALLGMPPPQPPDPGIANQSPVHLGTTTPVTSYKDITEGDYQNNNSNLTRDAGHPAHFFSVQDREDATRDNDRSEGEVISVGLDGALSDEDEDDGATPAAAAAAEDEEVVDGDDEDDDVEIELTVDDPSSLIKGRSTESLGEPTDDVAAGVDAVADVAAAAAAAAAAASAAGCTAPGISELSDKMACSCCRLCRHARYCRRSSWSGCKIATIIDHTAM